MRKSKFLVIVLGWILAAAPYWASAEDATVAENREKWNKLSEAEKNRLRASYRHFQDMGPMRRAHLLETYRRFKAEHPDRLERMIRIYEHYLKLTPDEQKTFLENVHKRRGWSREEIDLKKRRLERRYEIYKEESKAQSSSPAPQ